MSITDLTTNSRAVLRIAAIAATIAITVEAQPRRVSSAEGWAVSTVLASAVVGNEEQPLIWVGLKNQSQSARMICDYSAGYSVRDSDYQNGRIGGSSHNCSSRAAFALVLPGETRFFPIQVVPKDLRLGSAHVSVDFLFSSALFPSFGEKHDFQVSWTGTVVEIMNSTERLQK